MKYSLFIYFTIFVLPLLAQKDSARLSRNTDWTDFIENTDLNLYYDIPDSIQRLSLKKNLEFANNYNQDYAYDNALMHYLAAAIQAKKKKKRALGFYHAGLMAYQIKSYKAVVEFISLHKLFTKPKKKYNDAPYYVAQSYMALANYKLAKLHFRRFTKERKNDESILVKKAIIGIRSCNFALKNEQDSPYNIEILDDKINSLLQDEYLQVRGDELVFSRQVSDASSKTAIYTSINGNHAEPFSSALNYGDKAVGSPSFTADGNTIYYSKCKMQNTRLYDCNIYVSYLENGVWSSGKKLNETINEPESNTSHPQIVVDENGQEVLYFSAERKKGRGGRDIWYAIKNEQDDFDRAINMGYPINTRYDEIYPFYHTATKTLYFSSNGRVGLGGFDIYKTIRKGDTFEETYHLSAPINSSLDEYGFILNSAESIAYLSSNRKEINHKYRYSDIYELKPKRFKVYVKGKIYAENETSRELLSNATLHISYTDNDSIFKRIVVPNTMYETALDNDKNAKIKAQHANFSDVVSHFSTFDLNPADTLMNDIFFNHRTVFRTQRIGTIYYKFDNARLTDEAPKTLHNVLDFLKQYPESRVEVRAHTDNVGDAAYNLKLSQERATAAANYLIFYEIDASRIKKRWYGETQAIGDNTTAEGRAKNRRTEFWIVE